MQYRPTSYFVLLVGVVIWAVWILIVVGVAVWIVVVVVVVSPLSFVGVVVPICYSMLEFSFNCWCGQI